MNVTEDVDQQLTTVKIGIKCCLEPVNYRVTNIVSTQTDVSDEVFTTSDTAGIADDELCPPVNVLKDHTYFHHLAPVTPKKSTEVISPQKSVESISPQKSVRSFKSLSSGLMIRMMMMITC